MLSERDAADERARLLEPTASLHLSDELREANGEFTVPLAAVAVAVDHEDSEPSPSTSWSASAATSRRPDGEFRPCPTTARSPRP